MTKAEERLQRWKDGNGYFDADDVVDNLETMVRQEKELTALWQVFRAYREDHDVFAEGERCTCPVCQKALELLYGFAMEGK